MITYTIGDTRDVIATIPDGSVSLIATSPPFIQLRSYLPADHPDKHAEIGSEPDPATFIDTMLELTAEWGRVLAPWGSIAIELGDTFAGSGGAGGDYNDGGLRKGQPQFDGSTKYLRTHDPAIGPPISREWHGWRWWWRRLAAGEVSRARPTGLRTVTRLRAQRPHRATLTRRAMAGAQRHHLAPTQPRRRRTRRQVPPVHVADRCRYPLSETLVRPHRRTRNVSENSHGGGTWTTQGGPEGSAGQIGKTLANPAGAPPLDAWFDEYDGTTDTWTLTTQPSKLAHYAMWPAKLAERLILSMCPVEVCTQCGEPRRRIERGEHPQGSNHAEPSMVARQQGDKHGTTALSALPSGGSTKYETLGWTSCPCGAPFTPGTVLDVFAGTGTTLAVADLHGRDAIGIDIDARNQQLYEQRRAECARNLFDSPMPDANQLDLFGGVA